MLMCCNVDLREYENFESKGGGKMRMIEQSVLVNKIYKLEGKLNKREEDIDEYEWVVYFDPFVRETAVIKYCLQLLRYFTEDYYNTNVCKASQKTIEEYHYFITDFKIKEILNIVEFGRYKWIAQGYEQAFKIIYKDYIDLHTFVRDFYQEKKK